MDILSPTVWEALFCGRAGTGHLSRSVTQRRNGYPVPKDFILVRDRTFVGKRNWYPWDGCSVPMLEKLERGAAVQSTPSPP